jgi:hypothetical protein
MNFPSLALACCLISCVYTELRVNFMFFSSLQNMWMAYKGPRVPLDSRSRVLGTMDLTQEDSQINDGWSPLRIHVT